jgi:hypothetical protein
MAVIGMINPNRTPPAMTAPAMIWIFRFDSREDFLTLPDFFAIIFLFPEQITEFYPAKIT